MVSTCAKINFTLMTCFFLILGSLSVWASVSLEQGPEFMVFGVALLSVSALVLVPMGLAFCFCQLDNPEREESLTVRQEEHLSITIDEEDFPMDFNHFNSETGFFKCTIIDETGKMGLPMRA